MQSLIGREKEKKILDQALSSKEASLVVVYGRRRVGKTFLIREHYKNHLRFELTGMKNGSIKQQLSQFGKSLQTAAGTVLKLSPPANWTDAFHALEQFLLTLDKRKKSAIFFDEFPWLDGKRSGFLSSFEHFWNTLASRQSNLVVVVCGSAASWMINHIVKSKGALHQRITQRIRLMPFTLKETETYLMSRNINPGRYQILQIYMSIGGIPEYLKNIQKGESATQIIEKICFAKDGILTGEFKTLYQSLFDNSNIHIKIVEKLSSVISGMTRKEIIQACGLTSGGRATEMLIELEESGFIRSASPYDRNKKDLIYFLSDEYSLFYLKFIAGKKFSGKDNWIRISTGNSYKVWSGMAFEAVCLKHTDQIRKALGIDGVQTKQSAWRHVPGKGKDGAQIDLVIDRADMTINLCEMKFYNGEFSIDKAYAEDLERKRTVFAQITKTKKTLFLTMITTFGLTMNNYSNTLIQSSIKMDALFD